VIDDTGSADRFRRADVALYWLLSFLSADKKKTCCLYQAPSAAPSPRSTPSCHSSSGAARRFAHRGF